MWDTKAVFFTAGMKAQFSWNADEATLSTVGRQKLF